MTTEYLNNKAFEKIIQKFQSSKKDKARYELIIEDLRGIKTRKSKRKTFSKKDNKLLSDNQSLYKKASTEFGESQLDLANAFYKLSENIVRYAKFNLIDADDAVQEGVMICFEKIDRFDPCKGKAFNYMTTCILNHFRQLYRTARNYNELKKKYHDFLSIQLNTTIIRNGKEISSWQPNTTNYRGKSF